MSGIVNKIKDVLHGDHTHTTTGSTTGATNTTGTTGNTYTSGTAEGVAGPHSSRVANAMDPRVDSDMDGSTRVGGTTTGMTGNNYGTGAMRTTGTAEGVAGPHSSRLANTLDPRVDSDMDGSNRVGGTTTGMTGNAYNTGASGTTGTTGGYGPHSSSLMNKLDPRVDSTTGAMKTSGATGTTTGTGMTGNNYGSGAMTTAGTAEGTAGPHSSRVANAMDPRVDSDMDGSSRLGGTTAGSGMTGNTYGSGATTTTGSAGGHGPHSSSLLNKLDPRVDSTTGTVKTSGNTSTGMTGTRMTGNSGYTGDTGGLSNSTNAGPHNSNLANELDPRVDSDLSGRGNRVGASTGGVFGAAGSHATPGQGTAQNTAGPHSSDMMNKLDPRVDSDMDGSGTVGGNRTYAGTGTDARDQVDAAQVPPSVLRERLGDPEIMHDDPGSNHQGRHGSVVSHQERHI